MNTKPLILTQSLEILNFVTEVVWTPNSGISWGSTGGVWGSSALEICAAQRGSSLLSLAHWHLCTSCQFREMNGKDQHIPPLQTGNQDSVVCCWSNSNRMIEPGQETGFLMSIHLHSLPALCHRGSASVHDWAKGRKGFLKRIAWESSGSERKRFERRRMSNSVTSRHTQIGWGQNYSWNPRV